MEALLGRIQYGLCLILDVRMVCSDGEVKFNKVILSMAVSMLSDNILSSATSVLILLPDYDVKTVQVGLWRSVKSDG